MAEETRTEFPSFEENYANDIELDDERVLAFRTRVAVPLGINEVLDPITGYVNSGGITVESQGIGKLRVNMKLEVMESILDYYDESLTKAYNIIDKR
jgi:hypothetical protein